MDAAARITSKGQVTIPKEIREAYDLHDGDSVVFHPEGDRLVLTRTPDLLTLAGSIPVPPEKRDVSWNEAQDHAWTERAEEIG